MRKIEIKPKSIPERALFETRKSITTESSVSSSGDNTGTLTFFAGEALAKYDPVYVSTTDGKIYKAVAQPAEYITLAAIPLNYSGAVIRQGRVSYSFTTTLGNLWLNNGTISATPDETINRFLQLLGKQESATTAFFDIDLAFKNL